MRKITVYLVCLINDVINYSVDKMVLVSLNLDEYIACLPDQYRIRMNIIHKATKWRLS